MNRLRKRAEELYKISVPVLLEYTFITLMGIISTVMVASVGQHAISAVGMVDSISNLIIALFSALTTGGTIVVAQYYGRGDRQAAAKSGAQAIILSALISAVILAFLAVFRVQIIDVLYGMADEDVIEASNDFMKIINFSYVPLAVLQTVFGIMRGTGDTSSPMKISVLMNVLNVLIGRALIMGFLFIPPLGVSGAAWGLLLSRSAGAVIAFWYMLKKSDTVRLNKPAFFKPDFDIQKIILRFGVPTSIESSLFQVGRMFTQVFIVAMGTAAIMANSVVTAVVMFIYVPGNSFFTSVMILVGQRIGRGEDEDVEKTILFSVLAGSVMLGALCLICYPLTGVIITLYKADAEAGEIIRQVFYTFLIATPLFWSMSFISASGLRAAGDVKFTMVISVSTMFIVRICVGYILGVWLEMGVVGIWLGMYSDWVVRSVIYFLRIKSGKWKNKGIV